MKPNLSLFVGWLSLGWRSLGQRCLLGLIGILVACGLFAAPAQIALVDSQRIEAESVVLKRVRAEAKAQQGKLSPQEIEAGLENALSEVLTLLPDAVREVAEARKIDLVIEASAAKRERVSATDLTAEVLKRIDQQLATLKFAVP